MNRTIVSSLRRGRVAGYLPTSIGRRPFSSSPTSLSSFPTISINVQGQGTGTIQTVSVPNKSFKFSADTYTMLGGKDSAPTPLAYALASLGTCNQVTGSLVAKDHGIQLGEWHVAVEGQLPTAVLVHGEQGNPNWESVVLKARVQTDIAGGSENPKFQHFVSEIERRCPITQTFKRSGVKVSSTWENGVL